MPAKPAKPEPGAEAVAEAEPVQTAAPESTIEEAAAPEPAAALAPEPGTSGWYRNRGPVELTVLPDRYPSARLKPGAAAWFPADPAHPDLEPCDAPDPAADDTQEQ